VLSDTLTYKLKFLPAVSGASCLGSALKIVAIWCNAAEQNRNCQHGRFSY